MTLNRFKVIRGMVRFDNTCTRQGRLNRDKLAAVQFIKKNRNCMI